MSPFNLKRNHINIHSRKKNIVSTIRSVVCLILFLWILEVLLVLVVFPIKTSNKRTDYDFTRGGRTFSSSGFLQMFVDSSFLLSIFKYSSDNADLAGMRGDLQYTLKVSNLQTNFANCATSHTY